MPRTTLITIQNEYLKFSVAHFTIFSATERERLHGHNFNVSISLRAPVGDGGLCFDYNIAKRHLRALCDSLDEYVLIAGRSPHLEIREDGDQLRVRFADETLLLPASDTLVLPVANITAEELSAYLLAQLTERGLVAEHDLTELTVTVSSGPGQSGSTTWRDGEGIL
jgi:6-pyruvoyltetrahydropterin/6-carboxytetrahydropterin synthase